MTLYVRLSASSTIAAGLCALHVGAIGCLLATSLPWWTTALGAVLAGLTLGPALTRHAWLSAPRAVVAIECDARGDWFLRTRGGHRRAVAPAAGSVAVPTFAVLVFIDTAKRRRIAVLVAGDSARDDQRRRLRVALRLTAADADHRA